MIKKEPSMDAQKDLLAGYFQRLSRAKDEGRPVVYTFVPGNLVELMAAFDVAPARLLTSIVTERGVIAPVGEASVRAALAPRA
mgnify:CR=1 FL=1